MADCACGGCGRGRSQLKDFVGPSFDTISSTGSNGAIIHYKPPDVGSKPIDVDAMYLLDSGGQFKYVHCRRPPSRRSWIHAPVGDALKGEALARETASKTDENDSPLAP